MAETAGLFSGLSRASTFPFGACHAPTMPRCDPTIPLPRPWPRHAADALVQAVAMARVAIAHVRGGFALSPIERVRLRSDNERLRSELAQAREHARIKDARMSR